MSTSNLNKPKSIIILGGGVAGLTAATKLVYQGQFQSQYQITIIERNETLGGLARSETKNNVHSEYCWHLIGSGYYNLLNIFEEIGIKKDLGEIRRFITSQNVSGQHTRPATIDEIDKVNFLLSGSFTEMFRVFRTLNEEIYLSDIYYLLQLYLYAQTASDEHLEQLDNILWSEFKYVKPLSPGVKRWVADSPSIYFGMDIDKLSTHTMLNMLKIKESTNSKTGFYSTRGGFDEKIFQPWKQYLQNKGVKFIYEEVLKLDFEIGIGSVVDSESRNITAVHTMKKKIDADYIISALPIESLHLILSNSLPESPKSPITRQFKELADLSRQIQTQVLFYFDKKIDFDGLPTVIVLPDTPWFIMIKVEGDLWTDIDKLFVNEKTPKDIFAAGVGIFSRNGILYGKPAAECSPDELIAETWAQMLQSKLLKNLPQYIGANVWGSFRLEGGKLTTFEPKFSNNVGTFKLRPTATTALQSLDNFYICGSFCQTPSNIYNMESACESGIMAARELCIRDNCDSIPSLYTRQMVSNSFYNSLKQMNKKIINNQSEYNPLMTICIIITIVLYIILNLLYFIFIII